MLDGPTLLVASGATSVLLGVVTYAYSRAFRTYAGFARWTASGLALGAGLLLLAGRGRVPDLLSLPVANGLVGLSAALVVHGLARFFERPVRLWIDYSLAAATAAQSALFHWWRDDLGLRLTLFSVLMAVLLGRAAWLLLANRRRTGGPMERVAGGVFALAAFLYSVRAVYYRVQPAPPPQDPFGGMMPLGLGLLFALGWTFALVFMTTWRLQTELHGTVADLRKALAEVKRLRELLPICAGCRRIRDDQGYWQRIERYLGEQLDVRFSHGLCPDCVHRLYPELSEGQEPHEPEGGSS